MPTWEEQQVAGLGKKGAMAGTPPAQGCHKDLSLLRSWLIVVWWGRGKQALAGRPAIDPVASRRSWYLVEAHT